MQIRKLTPLILALALTACGGETTSKTEEPKEETKVEEQEKAPEETKEKAGSEETEESSEEETKAETEALEEDDDLYNPDNIGKTIEDPDAVSYTHLTLPTKA